MYFLGSMVEYITLPQNEYLANVLSPLWFHRDEVDKIFPNQDDNLKSYDIDAPSLTYTFINSVKTLPQTPPPSCLSDHFSQFIKDISVPRQPGCS